MCWGGGGEEGADKRGSEFNIDCKGADCGVSMGSDEDTEGVAARVVLMSIWKPLAGIVLCCEVGAVLILSCSAGAVSVVRGQEGSAVSMVLFVHEAEPEGRRGRLAACAPSAEGPSWFPGMA